MQETLVSQTFEIDAGVNCGVKIVATMPETEDIIYLDIHIGNLGPRKPEVKVIAAFSLPDDNRAPGIMKFDPNIAIGAFALCILPKLASISYDQVTSCISEAKKNSKTKPEFRRLLIDCLKAKGVPNGFQIAKAVAECLPLVSLGVSNSP